MLFDFLQFLCNYILAGFLLGFVHMKLAAKNERDPLANAIAFVK